ncbi:MAG: hypothetical protein ACXVBQ_14930, partial [Pseudobdellovibrionaceae bacterium]
SKYQMGDVRIYTRYNFSFDPNAYRSNLTQDQIVDRDGGDVQVYKGEAITPWALQKDGSTKEEVVQGYGVELVLDRDKISEMVRNESIKELGEKPIKMALNLDSDFSSFPSLDNNKVIRAFPCDSLVDSSKVTPRTFAEFQILTGRDVRNYSGVRWETKEIWNAMDMTAPIQELPATADEITSHAWCNWWYAIDEPIHYEKQLRSSAYDFIVKVKVFDKNGATSEQDYVGSFRFERSNSEIQQRFSDVAKEASRTTWTIGKNQRLSTTGTINERSNVYKLVIDSNGRKAIFSVNGEQPDYPLAVGIGRIYYDCSDSVPFKFQQRWEEWLPIIVEMQTKALK